MIALAVILSLLLLILLLPVGVKLRYEENGTTLSALFGLLTIRLLPRKRSKKPKEKEKKQPTKAGHWKESKKQTPATLGGKLSGLLPFVRMAVELLGDFRRRLRLKYQIRVTVGGSDPADTAKNYGTAWAAVGMATPLLQGAFRVKSQDVTVHCDFLSEELRAAAELKVTIRVGQVLWLLLRYGVRFIKQWYAYKKGGTSNESSGQ